MIEKPKKIVKVKTNNNIVKLEKSLKKNEELRIFYNIKKPKKIAKVKKEKICKECQAKVYATSKYCYKHHRENERIKKEEKAKKKKERHESSNVFKKEVEKKLIKTNDKLYQELGRQLYNNCSICGGEYSCLHHLVRKSQSLYTRYDIRNGIAVCVKCHCLIHQAQDSIIEARVIMDKGDEWLKEMEAKRRVIVYNKLDFLKEKNEMLKLAVQNS